jgi:hypothetical protein
MKTWIKVAIPVAAVVAVVAWYAFRPERLVVNRQVDEAMPTAQGGSSPQPLESGQFYSILHPTQGTATIYQMGDGTRILRLTSFSTSTARMCTFIWSPLTMPRTWQRWKKRVLLILE